MNSTALSLDFQEQTVTEGLTISQRFSVSTEDVFDAWTIPSLIKQWMYKGEKNDIVQAIVNLEPNGGFSVIKRNAEGEWADHYGHYHEIVRPNLLSFSLEVPDLFEGVSNIVLRLYPTEEGCELYFLQTGVEPDLVEDAWRKMLQRLSSLLEKQ